MPEGLRRSPTGGGWCRDVPPGRVRKPGEGGRAQRLSWGLESQLSTEEAPMI